MGDIVHLPQGSVELDVSLASNSPIERVDIFNGRELVETLRPHGAAELGPRIRILWEGAEYRGRFREVIWDGSARFGGNVITEARAINFFNRDKVLRRDGGDRLTWQALTTGNFGGFDVVLNDAGAGVLKFESKLVSFERPISEIGIEDAIYDASGELPRLVRVFRLPTENPHRTFQFSRDIPLRSTGDNPIFIRVTHEDGTRAWTSPIYVYR